jgi:hypothetical protein
MHTEFCLETPKGDLGIDVMVLLKWVLEEYV